MRSQRSERSVGWRFITHRPEAVGCMRAREEIKIGSGASKSLTVTYAVFSNSPALKTRESCVVWLLQICGRWIKHSAHVDFAIGIGLYQKE